MKKAKGEKKVKVELVEEFEGRGADRRQTEPYAILAQLQDKYHAHLAEARIAIVWRLEVTAGRDGKFVLGWAKKATDLDREFSEHDLLVILNRDAWDDLSLAQREALIDHELSHFAVIEKEGAPVRDERGRVCYRLRKHDLEEFRDVVARHGLYLQDVVEFAAVCAAAKKTPLFPDVAGSVGT